MVSLKDAKKLAKGYTKVKHEDLKAHLKAMVNGGTYSNAINAETLLHILERLEMIEKKLEKG